MPVEVVFAEILIPITFKIMSVSEEKCLPCDPWQRSWLVYFDKRICGEPLEYAIEASRKLISERFDVSLGRLEGMPTALSNTGVRVFIPK